MRISHCARASREAIRLTYTGRQANVERRVVKVENRYQPSAF